MKNFLDEILKRAEEEYEKFVEEEFKKGKGKSIEKREQEFFSGDLFLEKPLLKERFYLSREKRAEKVLANA